MAGRRRSRRCSLAVVAALASGCGTFCDVNATDGWGSGGTRIYGGVRFDGELMQAGGLVTFACLIDAPLSFVVDTLLLPVTIARQRRRAEASPPAPPPVEAVGAPDARAR